MALKLRLLIAFLIIASISFAQQTTQPNGTQPNFLGNVLVSDSLGCNGAFILNTDTVVDLKQFVIDNGGGGSSVDTTSLSNRIDVNSADILLKADTSSAALLATPNIFTKDNTFQDVVISDGKSLTVKDATNVDEISLSHNGTNGVINTTGQLEIDAYITQTRTEGSIGLFNTIYSYSSLYYPLIKMSHYGGSPSSVGNTRVGNILGSIQFAGYSNSARGGGKFEVTALENYSYSSAGGTKMTFSVNPLGAVYEMTAMDLFYDSNLWLKQGISMDGASSQTIEVERSTTGIGSNLSVFSGGAKLLQTDGNAGMLTLKAGISTGTGLASLRLQRNTRANTTSTSDNSQVDAIIIPSEFNLVDETSNSLFEIALPTLSGTGGEVAFTIIIGDGSDVQSYSGKVIYSAVNKGGVYTTNIVEGSSNSALSSGTLSTAWSVAEGTDKITITVTPTSSLIPTSSKISYTVINGGSTSITQL